MSGSIKILIDASGVSLQKTGVGVYAKNLIDNLSQAREPGQFYILAQDDDPEVDFSGSANVTMIWVSARFFRIMALRLLLEQLYLPYLLWKLDIDVVHSLHYAFPVIPMSARRVVTFHDMTFFSMPEAHQKIKQIYFRFFMRAAVRSVDSIIFVSRSAQEDCLARLGRPKGRSVVVPHGKDESLEPSTSPGNIERLREKYRLPKRFILYIGTIEPRKNLERLVTAFGSIAADDPEVGLVLAGKMGWMMEGLSGTIERLGISTRVICTGFILEEEKPILLSYCDVFIYPSLYEGFGLPALEALACGAPTITSNTSSLPEVVGDAALLVDPKDTEGIRSAMKLLLYDSSLREELRTRGFEQARKFTWKRTAAMTADVYLASNKG